MESKMGLTLLLVWAGTCLCSARVENDVNVRSQLEHFTAHRFPNEKYSAEHEKARQYIKDTFTHHGLHVKTQEFNTSVSTSLGSLFPKDEEVIGQNIIGIAPAISDKAEAVIVVAADYDTNGIDNPMMNNGAAMAVLLETIRLFMYNVRWSQTFGQNYTTVFVALDLNTREHLNSGGKPGGWFFVHEWLWSYLNHSDTNFGGAFILDHVMNINQQDNSQRVDADFREMFPDPFERIQEDKGRGNFLSMVTLNREKSIKLKDQFETGYNLDRMKRPYRLEDMTLPKSLSVSKLLSALTRQDSIHFWTFNHHNISTPLPAVLISDTEGLRDIPMLSNCTDLCQLTPEREEFLTSTTVGLLRTLLRRQAHTLPNLGNASTAFPTLIISMAIALLVRNGN